MLHRRALLVLSALLAIACGDDAAPIDGGLDASLPMPPLRDAGPALCPREGPLDARVPLRDVDVCAEGIVPMGFGWRWQDQAQFTARFGVGLDLVDNAPLGCPSSSALRGATLVAEASPGGLASDADVAVARFDYQVIGPTDGLEPPTDAGVLARRTTRARVSIELAPGEASGEGIALVDLAAAELAPAEHFVVAIDGIELTTELAQGSEYPPAWRPERGYALRRLGADIVEVTRTEDTLRVRVSATFEPGALERGAFLPGHDLAGRVARRRVTVPFVVVASDVEPTRGRVAYRTYSRASLPLAGGAPCEPPADQTALELDGTDSLARGVVGVTRFDVSMWPDDEGAGDLVREVSVRVRDLAYDAGSGRAAMRVVGYASNEGPLTRRGMDAAIEVDVALAQWSAGGEVITVAIAAPIGEGRAQIALPMR